VETAKGDMGVGRPGDFDSLGFSNTVSFGLAEECQNTILSPADTGYPPSLVSVTTEEALPRVLDSSGPAQKPLDLCQ
jgi:hypothetical protein